MGGKLSRELCTTVLCLPASQPSGTIANHCEAPLLAPKAQLSALWLAVLYRIPSRGNGLHYWITSPVNTFLITDPNLLSQKVLLRLLTQRLIRYLPG